MSERAKRSCAYALGLAGAILVSGFIAPAQSQARNLTVGPGKMYSTIRAAAQACQSGDTVSVDSGTYSGDVATWSKANLLVRRAPGSPTMPHLIANGASENDMGVWRVSPSGTNVTFDGFEIEGARSNSSATGNACGIRVEAGNPGWVAIRNCHLHDNQMNIMGAPDSLLVEYNQLDHTPATTVCDPTCRVGNQHNIYVNTGSCRSVMFRYNYSHDTSTGQLFKSRAKNSYVICNRLTDEGGTGSYAVDISDGGRAVVMGNVIVQGPNSENANIVSFGAEGGNAPLDFYCVNNTIVNDRSSGTFVSARAGTTGKVMNNIFYGPGTGIGGGSMSASNNYQDASKTASRFLSPGSYDYHLTSSTPTSIVGAATAAGVTATGFLLTPTWEYVHSMQRAQRSVVGALDLGAFEYTSGGVINQDVSAPSAVQDLRNR